MKKIYSLIMASAIALTANSQFLVINENFTGYTNPLGIQGGWVQNGSGQDVQINNFNPLIYGGYTSGGNYMSVASVDGTDPHKPFSTTITGAQTVYMSFVIRVSAAPEFNGQPNYSISLANVNQTIPANSTFPAQFYIAEENGMSNSAIEFGIAAGTNNPTYTNLDLQYGMTYLVIIRYDVVAGNNNDNVYLWVNPSLASEPLTASANAKQEGSNAELAHGNLINALKISQSDDIKSPDAEYDGFRVAIGATSPIAWTALSPAGAPLPVQLTSFNATEDGLNTKLVWATVEESGITSYVIEKSTDGRNFTTVGSVKAANLKTYSFTDAQGISDNSYYRLKMMEIDGTFKYSYIVSVKSKLTMNISLSPNPVKSMLMVQHPKAGEAGHIQIVSAAGQTIKDIRLSANAVVSNVDMSGFTGGLYHVIFRNGADVISKTILKQ
jgi:hypothetical protein